MKKTSQQENSSNLPLSGILFGALAAIGYTSANGFLRQLSESADPAWVAMSKAFCTVVLFGPWMLWLAWSGKKVLPALKTIGLLIAAGLFVQLAGNLIFQASISEIGVALMVPLTLGSMVVSGAIAGRIFLKEPVTPILAGALVCLVISIVVLKMGADKAVPTGNKFNYLASFPESIRSTIASVGAIICGISFTGLGVAVRISLKENIPSATPMVTVGICGLVSLGIISFAQNGTSLFYETTGEQWFYMAMVGLSNSLAFLSLTKALKKLPVVYVNAINVSQVAMATVMGVAIFKEPVSIALMIGLAIMFVGFAVMAYGSSKRSNDLRSQPSNSQHEKVDDPQFDLDDQRPNERLVELGVTNDSNKSSSFATSDSIHSDNKP